MKYQQYDVREDGVALNVGSSQKFIPWSELARLKPGRGEWIELVPRTRKHERLPVSLGAAEMTSFIRDLFATWGRHSRGVAAKAAIDYSANARTVGWLWISMSLLFPGLMTLLLLSDGIESRACSAKIMSSGVVTQGQIHKVSKNKRGNFVWDLEFKTADGQTITGKRTPFVYDEKGYPKTDSEITVVYAASSPRCFDLSMRPGENAVNMRQRVFTEWLTLAFGTTFGLVMLVGIVVGILGLRKRPPFAEAVKEAGAELMNQRRP